MSSYIENFHFRIPQLFLKAGLTDVALNGHLSTFLLCDHRRSAKEMRTYLQDRLNLWKKLEKRNEKCALMGGMNEQEFHELFQRHINYLENLLAHPKRIQKAPEVHITSRVLASGKKTGNGSSAKKSAGGWGGWDSNPRPQGDVTIRAFPHNPLSLFYV